jgi:hypothetical protein
MASYIARMARLLFVQMAAVTGIYVVLLCQRLLHWETSMTPDVLFEELGAIVETTELGTVIYRNAEGRFHRTAGPAIVFHTGDQHWYQNGKLHRTDGPANIFNGISHWFLNDMRLSEEEFNRRIASGEYRDP